MIDGLKSCDTVGDHRPIHVYAATCRLQRTADAWRSPALRLIADCEQSPPHAGSIAGGLRFERAQWPFRFATSPQSSGQTISAGLVVERRPA